MLIMLRINACLCQSEATGYDLVDCVLGVADARLAQGTDVDGHCDGGDEGKAT